MDVPDYVCRALGDVGEGEGAGGIWFGEVEGYAAEEGVVGIFVGWIGACRCWGGRWGGRWDGGASRVFRRHLDMVGRYFVETSGRYLGSSARYKLALKAQDAQAVLQSYNLCRHCCSC